MKKLRKYEKTILTALSLTLSCMGGNFLYASAGDQSTILEEQSVQAQSRDTVSIEELEDMCREFESKQSHLRDAECPWCRCWFSDDIKPLGGEYFFRCINYDCYDPSKDNDYYDLLKNGLVFGEELQGKIKGFSGDLSAFVRDFAVELEKNILDIKEKISLYEADGTEKVLDYILSFPTLKERMAAFKECGRCNNAIKIAIYKKICWLIRNSSGRCLKEESYRDLKFLKEAIDKRAICQLKRNKKVGTLFPFPPDVRLDLIEPLNQEVLDALLDDCTMHINSYPIYFTESRNVSNEFALALFKRLDQAKKCIRFAGLVKINNLKSEDIVPAFLSMNQDGKRKNFRHLMEVFGTRLEPQTLIQIYFDLNKESRGENLQFIPHEFFWKTEIGPSGYPDIVEGLLSKEEKSRIWEDLELPHKFLNWKLFWGESFCGNAH